MFKNLYLHLFPVIPFFLLNLSQGGLIMNKKAFLAEFIGTFGLTFAVLVSIHNTTFPVATPMIAAMTLGLFVYTLGPISGTHINPAVTLALFSVRKIGLLTAALYIASQFLGAFAAKALSNFYFMTATNLTVANDFTTGFGEFIGAAFFVFGITSVVLGRAPGYLSGIVIGFSLLLGISLAAPLSNGVLNPAVAFGIGSFSLAYVWGPIAGAIVGAILANIFPGNQTAVVEEIEIVQIEKDSYQKRAAR